MRPAYLNNDVAIRHRTAGRRCWGHLSATSFCFSGRTFYSRRIFRSFLASTGVDLNDWPHTRANARIASNDASLARKGKRHSHGKRTHQRPMNATSAVSGVLNPLPRREINSPRPSCNTFTRGVPIQALRSATGSRADAPRLNNPTPAPSYASPSPQATNGPRVSLS